MQCVGKILADSKKSELDVFGTGFMICDGLALTARHVIDGIFRKYTGKGLEDADGEMDFGVELAFVSKKSVSHCHIRSYSVINTTDMVLLEVFPDSAYSLIKMSYPILRATPPQPSQNTTAYGYPGSIVTAQGDGSYTVRNEFRSILGIVGDVYPRFRDSSLLNFPSFHVEAFYQSGLSGGPIVNSDDEVIGVVSSSFDLLANSGTPLSYGSLIYPIVGALLFDTARDDYPNCNYIMDLVNKDIIRFADRNNIFYKEDADGSVTLGVKP